jgi:hypothetical protein
MSSKQERTQLNLRLDGRKELLEAIKEAAEAADLSVNTWAIKAFESALGLSSSPKLLSAIAPSPALEERLAALEERLAALEASQMGELVA